MRTAFNAGLDSSQKERTQTEQLSHDLKSFLEKSINPTRVANHITSQTDPMPFQSGHKDTQSISTMQINDLEKSERMNIFDYIKSKLTKRTEYIIKGTRFYRVENGYVPVEGVNTSILLIPNDILEKGGKRAVIGEVRERKVQRECNRRFDSFEKAENSLKLSA